jgi:putative flippase GtrA
MSTVLRTPESTEAPKRRLTLRSLRRVFSRYTVGAAAATVVSVGTLSLVYGLHLLSARPASVAGWATGALTNYTLNRWWAWGRRGRPPLRELIPYWAIVLTTMSVSAWATGVAGQIGARVFETHGPRVVFVSGVFLGVYGMMFIGKFLLLYCFVFADPTPDGARGGQRFRRRRSRHQVPSTTRQ